MAGKRLSIALILNDKDFQTNLRKSTQKLKRFGKDMQRLGDDLTRNVSLPILAIGAGAVKLASDLEETDSKFRTVFSSIEQQAVNTAETFASEFKLAEQTSKDLLSSTGDLLVGFGFTEEAALELSEKVNRLSVDLASFQNFEGGAAGASRALTKALVGETESAKALGIVIRQNTTEYKNQVAQIMASQGVSELQAKAIANLDIAYSQSTKAIGDFARTQGSVANQTKSLAESFKDLGANLGKDLLPVAQSLIKVLNKGLSILSEMSPQTRENVIQFGLLAAALGPLIRFFGTLLRIFTTLRLFLFKTLIPTLATLAKSFARITPAGRIAFLIFTIGELTGMFDFLAPMIDKATKALKRFVGIKPSNDLVDFSSPNYTGLPFENAPQKQPLIFRGPSKEDVKNVREFANEVERIMPKGVSSVSATGGQTSPALQFATDPEFFAGIERAIVQFQNINDLTEEMDSNFESFGGAIEQAFATALVSQGDFFKVFVDNAKRALAQIAAQIAAMAVLNALLGGTKIGTKLGFKSIGGLSGIPKLFGFAEGGMVTGATIAMVGEGSGTSLSNPEVIAPLDKLQGMIGNAGGQVEVVGKISGSDILLASDRARGNRNRTRGY